MKVRAFIGRARRAILFALLLATIVCLLLSASSESVPHFSSLLLFAELLVGLVAIAESRSAAVGLPLAVSARSPPSIPAL